MDCSKQALLPSLTILSLCPCVEDYRRPGGCCCCRPSTAQRMVKDHLVRNIDVTVMVVRKIGESTIADVGSVVRTEKIGDNSRICLKVGCATRVLGRRKFICTTRVLEGRQVICAVGMSILVSIQTSWRIISWITHRSCRPP